MQHSNKWLARARGASTVETLFVIMFAILLVGGAFMVFGPVLAAKFEFAGKMLGMEPEPVRTLADGRISRPAGTNPIWYVAYIFAISGFFGAFVAPMMFPRARRTRQAIILDLSERFPMLKPLINIDARNEAGMDELRGLAADVAAMSKHKEGALEIQPHDYGKMALPSEQTVDADFVQMEALDDIIKRAERLAAGEPEPVQKGNLRPSPSKVSLMLREAGAAPDESSDTQMVVPLSERLAAVGGDDEIPFDAIDPSVKPQLQPLNRNLRNSTGGIPQMQGVPGAGDSTTVDVGSPDQILSNAYGDSLAAQVLRESGALPRVPADSGPTMIRDSGALAAMVDPDDATALVEPLDPRLVRSGPLAAPKPDSTSPDNIPGAAAADRTTQNYKSYDD